MTVLMTFILCGAATFALRSSMLVVGHLPVVQNFSQHMRFAGTAAVGAIVASSLFVSNGSATTGRASEVGAVIAALAAARLTGKTSATLGAGLVTFWILAALGL